MATHKPPDPRTPRADVPPGEYSYEEAKELGIATGVTPEEAGLPICRPDPDWEGFSSVAEATQVPDTPDECVADPEKVIYSVGRPIPHPGPHWSGYQTSQKWTGGKIEAEVLNPDVDHRAAEPYEFVAVRVLPHTPGGGSNPVEWIEVGWAEVSWYGPPQKVYTLKTDDREWHFYPEYDLNIGSFYAFRSYRCSPKECASIYWGGSWNLLDESSDHNCYTEADGKHCFVEEFVEVNSEDGTPHPALGGGADEVINFRDSRLREAGDSWIAWTESSVLNEDSPYDLCSTQAYTHFRVGKFTC